MRRTPYLTAVILGEEGRHQQGLAICVLNDYPVQVGHVHERVAQPGQVRLLRPAFVGRRDHVDDWEGRVERRLRRLNPHVIQLFFIQLLYELLLNGDGVLVGATQSYTRERSNLCSQQARK